MKETLRQLYDKKLKQIELGANCKHQKTHEEDWIGCWPHKIFTICDECGKLLKHRDK